MALKRALVVDDSKSARIALKKQLEHYNLSVDLADSGEDAIEFLKSHLVDVIFMDHVMPGMNGLEAVKTIKGNPRTAMIPVMMYTSKQGEVYVSQARALGAVDLLPKQVEPGVLFGMLLKLGLVHDRRATASNTAEPSSVEPKAEDDDKPAGMALSALLTRILEDQHSVLRSDILSSHRNFAKEVASEIVEKQKTDEVEEPPEEPAAATGMAGWPMLAGALATALAFMLVLFLQERSERAQLNEQVTQLDSIANEERRTSLELEQQLTNSFLEQQSRSEVAYRELLDTLAWAMNQSSSVPYTEFALNETRTEQIQILLGELGNAGFQGTVRIESHLGEFCLNSDITGIYRLASPETPFSSCSFVGHPLDNSDRLEDRQTPAFQNFVAESPLLNGSGIDLEIVLRQRLDSIPVFPYPIEPLTAGEWNAVAAQNNRLEYRLIRNEAFE